jgi:hypothetical protein
MNTPSPFAIYLAEAWRTRLFQPEIFPGFPFVQTTWTALAFSRDNAGNSRLPTTAWACLFRQLASATRDRVAFITSPEPIYEGLVAARTQPFVVALDEQSVLAHFSDMDVYLPEFFMAGASERWAIWGDSDLTVLGGQVDVISPVIDALGGKSAVTEAMLRDFGVTSEPDEYGMSVYLRGLIEKTSGRE